MKWLAAALAVAALVALAAVLGARGVNEAEEVRAEDSQRWSLARSMSQRRSYVAAAEAGGEIYAAGGMVGESGRFLDVFQRFDPERNSWTTLPRLPEPTRAAAGAALDGTIYVLGGQVERGVVGTVWAFDPEREEWTRRAPLPAAVYNHAAVSLAGKIYVLGGFAGEERSDVYVYDSESDSWSTAAPLPEANHAFGAVAFQGEIWTIGGRVGEEELTDVWIYDPKADSWGRGPELPRPMELVGAAVAGDEIHAVWESTYQIYDGATGSWRRGPRSLVTRHGLKAFVIEGMLYTVGGCTTDLHDSQVVERRRVA